MDMSHRGRINACYQSYWPFIYLVSELYQNFQYRQPLPFIVLDFYSTGGTGLKWCVHRQHVFAVCIGGCSLVSAKEYSLSILYMTVTIYCCKIDLTILSKKFVTHTE